MKSTALSTKAQTQKFRERQLLMVGELSDLRVKNEELEESLRKCQEKYSVIVVELAKVMEQLRASQKDEKLRVKEKKKLKGALLKAVEKKKTGREMNRMLNLARNVLFWIYLKRL